MKELYYNYRYNHPFREYVMRAVQIFENRFNCCVLHLDEINITILSNSHEYNAYWRLAGEMGLNDIITNDTMEEEVKKYFFAFVVKYVKEKASRYFSSTTSTTANFVYLVGTTGRSTGTSG